MRRGNAPGAGGEFADIEQIVVYADSGSTVLATLTSQEIYDQVFSG